jgi:GTP-binding protein Era
VSADPERPLSEPDAFRAGFCAIAGLPNVGKSTLLNGLIGQKLSIVTPKAQTTRQRLLGIYSDEGHQAVFVDTPGMLEPRYLLQERMRAEAERAIADADLVLYVADAGYAPSVEHALALGRSDDAPSSAGPDRTLPEGQPSREDRPWVLCLNKVDRVPPEELQDLRVRLDGPPWDVLVPTVATEGLGVEELKAEVLRRLPFSQPFYPPEDLAVAPVRFFVAEIIRETAFERLSAEVPYATAVTIEEYREPEDERNPVYIDAVIHVERPSQKGIVIGSGGKMICRIGTEARMKIEEFTGRKVFLDLRVKVLRNWRRREGALKLLGFRPKT